jgi:hypothetical protein
MEAFIVDVESLDMLLGRIRRLLFFGVMLDVLILTPKL